MTALPKPSQSSHIQPMKQTKFPWPVLFVVLIAMIGAGVTVAIGSGLSGLFEPQNASVGAVILVLAMCAAVVLRWSSKNRDPK